MALWKFTACLNYEARPSEFWTASVGKELGIEDVEDSSLVVDADDFAAALADKALSNVVIDRIVISTWQPDSDPYDPEAVRTVSYGLPGLRGFLASEPTDDTLAYFIRKNVNSGRSGKFYLRGWMLVSDLTAGSGAWALSSLVEEDFADNVDQFFNLLTNTNSIALIGLALLDTIYPAVPLGTKQVPVKMYSETPTVRAVASIVGVRPTERQERQ